jgi:hypothetical protein
MIFITIIVRYFQTKVIDKSLSGHCHLSNTCERDLRVMNKQNGINLGSLTYFITHDAYYYVEFSHKLINQSRRSLHLFAIDLLLLRGMPELIDKGVFQFLQT